MMTLYYSDILSAHRACAAVRYLNAPVKYEYLDLLKGDQRKPGYLAINPNGKVPTLVKGKRITWESDAVICQLSEDMGCGSAASTVHDRGSLAPLAFRRTTWAPERRTS
jgi:glutathione S-transferase